MKILIVDDEPLARERICDLLAQEDAAVNEIREAANGQAAVAALKTNLPDLLFLDVQMPYLNGFEVLQSVGAEVTEKIPAIVFVTAFDRYALQAFEFHAVDYLLKPFTRERFAETLERVKRQISAAGRQTEQAKMLNLLEELTGKPKPLEWITVRKNERILLYRTADLQWIEAQANYALLKFAETSELIRETMEGLEKQLDPRAFIRIHRSTIVNVNFIKEIQIWFQNDYRIIMTTGKDFVLTNRYRDKFMNFFKK